MGITVMKWPPNSPDLNIIENIWAIVQQKMDKRYFATFAAFKEGLIEEWNNLQIDKHIRVQFNSMNKRLELLL